MSGNFQPTARETASSDKESDPKALRLITYSLPFHRSPTSGLNSWLLETLPENFLQINTLDAKKLKIQHNDIVILTSTEDKTTIKCKAQIIPGIRPGVVALAGGFGYSQAGASSYSINGASTNASKPRSAGVNPSAISARTVTVRKI